jgi:nitroreductase
MTGTQWSVPVGGELSPALRDCLEAAVAAPSIHNSQPWRFRLSADGVVDVYVDHSRRLEVLDPRGREALISVGAAVFNLRVAMLARGRVPMLELLPSLAEPNLAARVAVGPPVHVPETARMLDHVIPLRRTNRRPFDEISLPKEVLGDLAAAARVEGGDLVQVDPLVRDTLLGLVRTAEMRRRAEPAYWTELADWTLQANGRDDGVPPEAYGPWSAMEAVPLRDFGLVQHVRRREVRMYEIDPTIAVLYSPGDTRADWLRAGQALERTLLTATVRGVATTLMTQPLEYPDLRALIADPRTGHRPQAIVRFGYGPPSPPTPRRPLAEVVDVPTTALVGRPTGTRP